MKFSDKVNKFLKTVGEKTTVSVSGEIFHINALIEPMRYKNKLYLEQERTQLGFKDSECFLYLGPAEPDLSGWESETVVKTADRCFSVSRADRIVIGGVTQYIWAVLTPRIKVGAYYEQ